MKQRGTSKATGSGWAIDRRWAAVAVLASLGAMIALLTFPAGAARADHACGIPEGCDLDGDGVIETPGGTLIPHGGDDRQYERAPVIESGYEDPLASDETVGAGYSAGASESRVLPDTGGVHRLLALAAGSVLLAGGCGLAMILARDAAGARH